MSLAKIVSRQDLIEQVGAARADGQTVAFANGLFDLLHVGHLRYLEAAAQEADHLVVAINADSSAKTLKGEHRPLVPELERAELIAGMSCVRWVTIFSELEVTPLLRELVPDVHCKGTDYTPETVPEAPVARELGIRIAIVGDPKDHGTRDIIRQIRELDL